MIYVNIPKKEFKKKELLHTNKWAARFNETTTDGIVHAVEHILDHEPTDEDFETLKNQWFELNKSWKVLGVQGYAKEPVIKHFKVNDNSVWIDSDTRTSLSKALADKKAAGRTETTLYLGGVGYNMSIEQAENLLSQVEIYASDCFEVTETHKTNIQALTTIDAVLAYDYTTGYPEELSFTFNIEN